MTLSFIHFLGVATSYVILPVADQSVDGPVSVRVEARDQFGNVAVSQQRDVTITVDGAQATLVDIVNGRGSFAYSKTTPQTNILALVDSAATGLTVSSTQPVNILPG